MMYVVCELCVMVWYLSAQGEKVVNINSILLDTYIEDELPDDSIIRWWWREFLAGYLLLEEEERSWCPCDCVGTSAHLVL